MSLSGQYLEELSRRYKKQVEEMQRSFERAVSAMSEESRKGEEREAKRVEEIAILREEIAVLSKSVQTLLHDQDSWQSRISAIGQHALLIWLEVVVITLFLSYCRRTSDFEENERIQLKDGKAEGTRRKSAENFASHEAAKKTKKRRPSEIASHINSTYHELMIDERCHETKKERKKKRKKEAVAGGARIAANADARPEAIRHKSALNVIPGSTTLPSRRASSIDSPRSKESHDITGKRPESAPETTSGWFDDQAERIERTVQLARPKIEPYRNGSSDLSHHDEFSESNSSSGAVDRSLEGSVTSERRIDVLKNRSFRTSGILKSAKLSSPSFMKTALGARSKRRLLSNSERWDWSQDSEYSNSMSIPSTPTGPLLRTNDSANGSAARGLIEESDESRSSSATRTSSKKEKKSTGLRKMVRKFF